MSSFCTQGAPVAQQVAAVEAAVELLPLKPDAAHFAAVFFRSPGQRFGERLCVAVLARASEQYRYDFLFLHR